MKQQSLSLFAMLVISLAVFSSSGCYTVRYHTRIKPTKPPISTWNNIFLWGLAGSATVKVHAACPEGLARLEMKRTFGNLMVSLLTLGLYTPSSVKIWCGSRSLDQEEPTAWRGDLSRERYRRHQKRVTTTRIANAYVLGGAK